MQVKAGGMMVSLCKIKIKTHFVYKFDKNTTSTKSLEVLPPIRNKIDMLYDTLLII